MVFKISKSDVERSSTLEKSDIGKFGVLVSGMVFIKETEKEARELEKFLND